MTTFAVALIVLYVLSFLSAIGTRYVSIPLGNSVSLVIAGGAFSLAAFRPSHFPDVDTYEFVYDNAASGEFTDPLYWLAHGEPVFKLLCYAISLVGGEYRDLLVFMSIGSYSLLCLIGRASKINFSYIWFCYFSVFFITRDFGVIRLAIASHLIVLALLQTRFVSRAVLFAISSITFQYFSFVTLGALFFARFRPTVIGCLVIIVVSAVLGTGVSADAISFLIPEKLKFHLEAIVLVCFSLRDTI